MHSKPLAPTANKQTLKENQMSDWSEKSEYTGNCPITRMVWNIEDTVSWWKMREVVAVEEYHIESCVAGLLRGRYPIFDCGANCFLSVETWKRDWDAFIISWAKAEAAVRDYDRAEDEDQMDEMLEELHGMEVIPGETVDAFNERLWQAEVDGMMDALSEDFDALKERLAVARTMLLAATGEVA